MRATRPRLVAASALLAVLVLGGCGSTVQTSDGSPLDASMGLPAGTTIDPNAGLAVAGGSGTGLTTGGVGGGGATGAGSTGSAGGTTSSAGGTTASAGGTSTGGGTSSPTGRTTGKVEIGFLDTSVGNAGDFGFDMGNSVSGTDVIKALVTALNKQGGLAGREIVPVIAGTDTASTSWEADFQAACSKFTEDNHVASVVGYDFVALDSFETCLAKAGVSHLTTGYDPGDATMLQQYPYLVSLHGSYDEKYRMQIQGAWDEGWLTTKNKLGVIVDSCPAHTRAYQREVLPFIRAKNINLVQTVTSDCPRGSGGSASGLTQIQNAVLSFQSKGIDRAWMSGIPLYFFSQNAESQGYHPGYITDGGGASLDANPLPEAQMKNIHMYGDMPIRDVSSKRQPPLTPVQKECISLAKAGGVTPKTTTDLGAVYQTCDPLLLLRDAMEKTKGDASAAAVVQAIGTLGTSFKAAELITGNTSYSPTDRTGNLYYGVSTYQSSCSCFGYSGPAKKMP